MEKEFLELYTELCVFYIKKKIKLEIATMKEGNSDYWNIFVIFHN